MVVDLGTGDGRAVFARAVREPATFVIGIDANAAAMAEASRRAHRGRSRVPNACFLVEAAERLPGPLAAMASLVTVTFPWGSLLRGALGLDRTAMSGVASLVAPSGCVEVLASVVPSDRVDGVSRLDFGLRTKLTDGWRSVGLELVSMRPVTDEELTATRSSWARRLGRRPAWRLELRRCDRSPPRAGRRDLVPGVARRAKMGDTIDIPKRPQPPTDCRPPAEDLRTWPR